MGQHTRPSGRPPHVAGLEEEVAAVCTNERAFPGMSALLLVSALGTLRMGPVRGVCEVLSRNPVLARAYSGHVQAKGSTLSDGAKVRPPSRTGSMPRSDWNPPCGRSPPERI
jgi:hypothetical protein